MSEAFNIFLGIAELAGGQGAASGVLTRLAAFALIPIMLGANGKKIFRLAHWLQGRESLRPRYDLIFIPVHLLISSTVAPGFDAMTTFHPAFACTPARFCFILATLRLRIYAELCSD